MQNTTILEKYGFKFTKSGAHSARNMMLNELLRLFSNTSPKTTKKQYQQTIIEQNLLAKPTNRSRILTFRHLADLYGLDTDIPIFRNFRKLWPLEQAAQPLLALQLALLRDPFLRLTLPLVQETMLGEIIPRTTIEERLTTAYPDRFSRASLQSYAQNINGSWTQAGFLHGKFKKIRSQPIITPVNLTFALFLGWLEGATGERLLHNKWCQLLGKNIDQLRELAIAASHRGLIDFKQSSGVTEIRFTDFLTQTEEQWQHE